MLKTKYFSVAVFLIAAAIGYFIIGQTLLPAKIANSYMIGKILVSGNMVFAQGK